MASSGYGTPPEGLRLCIIRLSRLGPLVSSVRWPVVAAAEAEGVQGDEKKSFCWGKRWGGVHSAVCWVAHRASGMAFALL
jgi:hypothetical protein